MPQRAPVVSPDAKRICTLSGLDSKLQSRLVELNDLDHALEVAIRDIEQATKNEYFWRAMEVVAKFVSALCDVAVGILGGFALGVVYDTTKMIVDALNKDLTTRKAFIYSANAKLGAIGEHLSAADKTTVGRVVSATTTLVSLASDFYDYIGEGAGDRLFAKSGLIGARATALAQLNRIRVQISEVEKALAACK
jgi:hypothetical protein